jgi:hypothetical protein
MSFLSDLVLLLEHGPGSVPVLPPAGDPGLNAPGGDSTGLFPGGGTNAGGDAGGGSFAPSSTQGGTWLDPRTGEHGTGPGPALDIGLNPLTAIWQQITAGAPIVGVYALLALLLLVGVIGLVLSSSPGQAAVRAGTAEVTGGASEVGRAVGRRITRRKPPPKS